MRAVKTRDRSSLDWQRTPDTSVRGSGWWASSKTALSKTSLVVDQIDMQHATESADRLQPYRLKRELIKCPDSLSFGDPTASLVARLSVI